ncbi:ISAs1 family transposase [Nocardia sp. NEAU-G5]|uniref:ISAs1 family transposase n=1 Tax=Nocardia albiluteola TaxID=2842303 RepID=A0ABS6BC36_9NOCA|nr:ISAs1 family transposase [Nocardia albiluteola]MBU3067849.1 ISAs1 family transposase [Nocardia albiluteola]
MCGASGARSFAAIAEWAVDAADEVLRGLGIEVPDGSTIRRALSKFTGDGFDQAVGAWLAGRLAAAPATCRVRRRHRRAVAVDGKTLRGSRDGDTRAVMVMACLDHDHGVVLNQAQIDDKSNEIPSFAPLLDGIADLTGVVVTADALHAQTEHAEYLHGRGADYVPQPWRPNRDKIQRRKSSCRRSVAVEVVRPISRIGKACGFGPGTMRGVAGILTHSRWVGMVHRSGSSIGRAVLVTARRSARIVVVAVVVSGLVAGCGVGPGQSPRPAKIVYPGDRYGIFAMNPDGTGVTRIGEGDCPNFARDGSKIAVGGLWITVMDPDGGNVRKLLHGGYGCPAFSPDGAKIAFTRGTAVYLMNADGGMPKQLYNDPTFDPVGGFQTGQDVGSSERPAFSPDGSKIVFAEAGAMWVMAADGAGARQLLPGTSALRTFQGYNDSDPVFTPDGAGIVFSRSRSSNAGIDRDMGIYRMDVDGRNIRLLRTNGDCPSFSPDGSKILYSRMTLDTASEQGASFTEVWVMDSDGSNPHRLIGPKESVQDTLCGSWGRAADS